MKNRALSMRYAKALFELAEKQKLEINVENDLRTFLTAVKKDKADVFFESPLLTQDEKKVILQKLLKGRTSTLIMNFLFLLTASKRFNLLGSIADAYHELLNQSRHFEEIVITTARPLKPALRESLEKMIAKKLGEKVISQSKVNPSLLGGISIQIRNRLFDGSLRTQLNLLKKQMIGLATD
ncbi:MAG: ATP synthase F1 subunit delta [Candidatus Omnitrophica bacterium CG11_big_fil_rev_8_21_14_0_20_45_26]|uniref:ATP synthase subunit delta n=1 Tax=Candidatus Abzuiibacterium crystallinum TaxID=1974748 RepID=A0A2H0LM47_9BACT|nr:MAG: ATP synthase F1 subunit delta [Candidatus Omnitrophica bacterium CG11_big_fil_rev_8_21_14_0_20_45_26]PIW63693.1 MAG: ATP synthase F1 subunit delta [Candidatus Omnitrophica bacterium CG12_big_fil_rev_8_21_14_0_65_45_16]